MVVSPAFVVIVISTNLMVLVGQALEYPSMNKTNASAPVNHKTPLYIGGYFTLGGNWDGSGILPAVEMALDHVNDRNDILNEYELKMVWNDTQVKPMQYFL